MPVSDSAASNAEVPVAKRTWREAFAVYTETASLRMLALGFAAGLPLLLVFGTLSFWLREAGVNRATIGFISWVTLAYAFKWAWAPLVDRVPIPWLTARLGRRRSWLLAAQLAIIVGLVGMALTDPKVSVMPTVWFALLVAFASATQDIALDAYRIESAGEERQAALSAMYQTGYRLAMIWAGAGVLWIAARAEVANPQNYDPLAWRTAYLIMAASMLVGVATVLFSREPARAPLAHPRGVLEFLRTTVVEPFADFFRRYRWQALLLLALIATYRVSDIVMGVMANPFYVDMGYTKDEVAAIAKVYGVAMTLVGAFVGGVLAMRIGLLRTLALGALLSAATNLLFAWLAMIGRDLTALTFAISLDNLAAGIAATAFIAYMSSLVNIAYSATQYALMSSMMLLLPKWLAGFSGVAVNAVGYTSFFIGTALLGLPVLALIYLAGRYAPVRGATAPSKALPS
ncbi:MAG: MFS transporter [Casimicrobiaceae bacterium]|nr:MFS transporter [Casimicrobiaceae bacterium]MDW8313182.1 MFS transporter [Burkholderiales bacterium]